MLFDTLKPFYLNQLNKIPDKKKMLLKQCLDIITIQNNYQEIIKKIAKEFDNNILWKEFLSENDIKEISLLLIGIINLIELYPNNEIYSIYDLISASFSTIYFILDIKV